MDSENSSKFAGHNAVTVSTDGNGVTIEKKKMVQQKSKTGRGRPKKVISTPKQKKRQRKADRPVKNAAVTNEMGNIQLDPHHKSMKSTLFKKWTQLTVALLEHFNKL
ncbi:hypothetical protein DdX_19222 [Ditylenchus destructor]|uniref:Uncharacterized protein n=1 Tax=Ditylenchus destructor TaxID=166010 RepID=A0AAD4MNJ5_9BILA|nr:hypothetical protein DdX_19222 [Ditylenchus destructor]